MLVLRLCPGDEDLSTARRSDIEEALGSASVDAPPPALSRIQYVERLPDAVEPLDRHGGTRFSERPELEVLVFRVLAECPGEEG
jgi:hypothetical protein